MAHRSSNGYKPSTKIFQVLNNGVSTGPFEIQRGVRQGDPLSPYLFIIILEVLAISIRKNRDIQGIVVDGFEIIFDFVWKGKDKVKRVSLVGDIKDEGLKAQHLESIIKTHRIMLCQRFVDEEPCNWKNILCHYLKQVGGK